MRQDSTLGPPAGPPGRGARCGRRAARGGLRRLELTPPAVPSLSQSASAKRRRAVRRRRRLGRAAALHAAAQCIRQHGIPGYADPVLTPSGQVYTDTRSFQDVPQSVANAVQHACRALIATAGLNPSPSRPPAAARAGRRPVGRVPARTRPAERHGPHGTVAVHAGSRVRQNASEMPAGGKASPVWQQAAARRAGQCRDLRVDAGEPRQ